MQTVAFYFGMHIIYTLCTLACAVKKKTAATTTVIHMNIAANGKPYNIFKTMIDDHYMLHITSIFQYMYSLCSYHSQLQYINVSKLFSLSLLRSREKNLRSTYAGTDSAGAESRGGQAQRQTGWHWHTDMSDRQKQIKKNKTLFDIDHHRKMLIVMAQYY